MESYSKEILRKKVINRILKCSSEYSLTSLDKLDMNELFNIQSVMFKKLLANSSNKFNYQIKQTS